MPFFTKIKTPNKRMKRLSRLRSSSFLSGTAIYFISNIINAAIPFALLPILTRYLEPSEYGQVAMFQTFLGALGAFVGLNVAGAAARKYYDSNGSTVEIKAFIAACLQILLASAAITFLVVWSFNSYLTNWVGIEVKWLMLAILVASTTVIITLRLTQWQVSKKPINYGALQISRSAFNMAISLLLVVVFLQGGGGHIEAQIWTASLFGLISLGFLKRDNLLSFFSWNPSYIREALHFGVPLIPHVAGGFLLASVDRFVINDQLGLAQAGIYMVAVQISMSLALVFDSINKAYVPWLFERLKRNIYEEKKEIVRNTYIWYLIIIFGISLAFWIGPLFVEIIAGKEYVEAGAVIGWLALGQGFSGMYLMVTNYIFYSKRTGLLSLVTLSSGLLNLALLFLLIPLLGLKGAAIAFSIAMGIRFLLTWWVAQKRHPMPWLSFA
jgi:O-antigen/teichoic acid export membrane protein